MDCPRPSGWQARPGPAGAEGLNQGILAQIRKAATLAQALDAAKAPRGTVAGGLERAAMGGIRLLFHVRPETEPALFGGAQGG